MAVGPMQITDGIMRLPGLVCHRLLLAGPRLAFVSSLPQPMFACCFNAPFVCMPGSGQHRAIGLNRQAFFNAASREFFICSSSSVVPPSPALGSVSAAVVDCAVNAGGGTPGCVCLGVSVEAAGCEDVTGCPGNFWAGSEGEAANDATVGVNGEGVGVGGAGIVGGAALGAGL